MDRGLLPAGVTRAPLGRFLLWLVPWIVLLGAGLYAAGLCLVLGLNQTHMDNRFAFGLWIFLDLTVIAFGAGAFFSGLLYYLMRRHDVGAVLPSAVVIGLICYSGAVAILAIDVGQPLRAWFTFWHPNVHSMLTEVTFCITCYLVVLGIEYAPLLLQNRRIAESRVMAAFGGELHRGMVVFAGIGALLSFFHQGSLGGLYGVLRGRPFAFREGFAIWPSTFFLFVLSAMAVGPSFLLLVTRFAAWVTGKRLVPLRAHLSLARLSGWLLVAYVGFKAIDTLVWANRTSPSLGFSGYSAYAQEPFGTWILLAEILLLGLLPASLLITGARRGSLRRITAGALLACLGVAVNRFVITVQTQALPTLAFDALELYLPSWQETVSFLAVHAYGVLLYSLSYRYLPLFPKERASNSP